MRLQAHHPCNLALCLPWNLLARNISTTGLRHRQEDRQSCDIFPNDLTATLEKHRASNRASIIRRVKIRKPKDGPASWDNRQARIVVAAQAASDGAQNITENSNSAGKKTSLTAFVIYKIRKDVQSALPDDVAEKKVKHIVRSLVAAKARAEIPARVDPTLYRYGRYIGLPLAMKATTASSFKPWESESSKAEPDKRKRLSAELLNLQDWLLLTPSEKQFRQDLTRAIIYLMKKRDKDVEFYAFGSSETGIATTMSDIDIGFMIPSVQKVPGQRGPSSGIGQPEIRKKIFRLLHRFYVNSCTDGKYKQQELVFARFPLLRMKHRMSDIEIQIVASAARPAVIDIVKSYVEEYPQLVPVYLVLKATLAARELDEPRTGGIGSYTLLMMIAGAFKVTQMSRRTEISTALLVALRFYGDLETTQCCVSVDPPAKFPKRYTFMLPHGNDHDKYREDPALWRRLRLSVANEQVPYLLCLQDPADPENDLGRAAWRVKDILKTFKELSEHISLDMNDEGFLHIKQLTPLQHLLGTSMDNIKAKRDAFRLWSSSRKGLFELKRLGVMANLATQNGEEQKSENGAQLPNMDDADPVVNESTNQSGEDMTASYDDYNEEMQVTDQISEADFDASIEEAYMEPVVDIDEAEIDSTTVIDEMAKKDSIITMEEMVDVNPATTIDDMVGEDSTATIDKEAVNSQTSTTPPNNSQSISTPSAETLPTNAESNSSSLQPKNLPR